MATTPHPPSEHSSDVQGCPPFPEFPAAASLGERGESGLSELLLAAADGFLRYDEDDDEDEDELRETH